jgi:hypothetical protein
MRTIDKPIIDITAHHEGELPMIQAFARVYALVIEDGKHKKPPSTHLLPEDREGNLKSSERRFYS